MILNLTNTEFRNISLCYRPHSFPGSAGWRPAHGALGKRGPSHYVPMSLYDNSTWWTTLCASVCTYRESLFCSRRFFQKISFLKMRRVSMVSQVLLCKATMIWPCLQKPHGTFIRHGYRLFFSSYPRSRRCLWWAWHF